MEAGDDGIRRSDHEGGGVEMRTKLTLEESLDLLAEEIKLAKTAKDYHFVAYLKDIVRELKDEK